MAAQNCEQTTAFNLGAQARLDGLSLDANPHAHDLHRGRHSRYAFWRRGWWEVDLSYGVEATGYVPPLKEVAS